MKKMIVMLAVLLPAFPVCALAADAVPKANIGITNVVLHTKARKGSFNMQTPAKRHLEEITSGCL